MNDDEQIQRADSLHEVAVAEIRARQHAFDSGVKSATPVWTTEPPAEPGWYHYRDQVGRVLDQVVEVFEVAGVLAVDSSNLAWDGIPLKRIRGEWASIPEPRGDYDETLVRA